MDGILVTEDLIREDREAKKKTKGSYEGGI